MRALHIGCASSHSGAYHIRVQPRSMLNGPAIEIKQKESKMSCRTWVSNTMISEMSDVGTAAYGLFREIRLGPCSGLCKNQATK